MKWIWGVLLLLLVPSASAVSVLIPVWANETVVFAKEPRILEFTMRGEASNVSGRFVLRDSGGVLSYNGTSVFEQLVSFSPYEMKKVRVSVSASKNNDSFPVSFGVITGSGMFENWVGSSFTARAENISSSQPPSHQSSSSSSGSSSGNGIVIDVPRAQGNKTNATATVSSPPPSPVSSPATSIQDIAGQESGVSGMVASSNAPAGSKVVQSATGMAVVKSGKIVALLFICVLLIDVVLQIATIRYVQRMEG